MNKYGFRIVWSDEDEGYIATSPEFPGLSAFGETQEEALAEAKVAQELFIEDMRERGEELPRPLEATQFSGQFRVRLPKSLHRQASELAAEDNVSLNQFVVGAVEQRVGFKRAGVQLLGELRQAIAAQSRQLQGIVATALTDQRVTTQEEVSETYSLTRKTLMLDPSKITGTTKGH